MVGIATVAGTSYGRKVTLDVILCVAVNQSSFCIQSVFTPLLAVAGIEVHIVTAFRFQVGFSRFQVAVTKQFLGAGHAQCLLVRELQLDIFPQEIRACRSISEGTDTL